MKKWIGVFILIIGIFVLAVCLQKNDSENYDYLRLHIRANSNSEIDQNVKYEIKSVLVEFLTPCFGSVKSKEEAVELVRKLKVDIEKKCDEILIERGFNYKSNVKVDNEYFPTRSYSNVTLDAGFYDAVIVELGTAEGDNWWCIMYPPLCFVNKIDETKQIKYESRILNWLKNLFN